MILKTLNQSIEIKGVAGRVGKLLRNRDLRNNSFAFPGISLATDKRQRTNFQRAPNLAGGIGHTKANYQPTANIVAVKITKVGGNGIDL
jgi:hypothetical protein